MSDQKYTARQIVWAVKHLSTLDVMDMIERDYIDFDAVVKNMTPQRWDVTLRAIGERKIGAIKILRAPRGSTFRDLITAKDIADRVEAGTPEVVFSLTDEDEARDVVRMFTENGSTATFDPVY